MELTKKERQMSCGNVEEDWQVSKTCVQERFKQLLFLSRWTDCSFRVGHRNVEVIHAHKLVLAVSSPVFEALFFGPLSNPENQVISVPDIEPHTFKTFLQYLYSDEVDLSNIEEAGDLLYTAKKYLVQPLASTCLAYLIQHTWIKTLWDILDIAEALSEEKLQAACVKIMSRYQYRIWASERDNMSQETLVKLLEENEMNMNETQIWEMVDDWARKEAEVRGLDNSCPQARRTLLEKAGVISRVRFLTIPHSDLGKLLPVFSEQEVAAIKEGKNLPSLMSQETCQREYAKPLVWVSTRDILSSRNHFWFNRGEVVCNICSTSKVLVTGFEVLSRVAQITPYIKTAASSSYREKLVVFVKDMEGNVIHKTDYDNKVQFNVSQNIQLSQPVWFEENTKYSVNISFICGQYPILNANDSSSRGTKFFYDEMILLENLPCKIPFSYIMSVLYAL